MSDSLASEQQALVHLAICGDTYVLELFTSILDQFQPQGSSITEQFHAG